LLFFFIKKGIFMSNLCRLPRTLNITYPKLRKLTEKGVEAGLALLAGMGARAIVNSGEKDIVRRIADPLIGLGFGAVGMGSVGFTLGHGSSDGVNGCFQCLIFTSVFTIGSLAIYFASKKLNDQPFPFQKNIMVGFIACVSSAVTCLIFDFALYCKGFYPDSEKPEQNHYRSYHCDKPHLNAKKYWMEGATLLSCCLLGAALQDNYYREDEAVGWQVLRAAAAPALGAVTGKVQGLSLFYIQISTGFFTTIFKQMVFVSTLFVAAIIAQESYTTSKPSYAFQNAVLFGSLPLIAEGVIFIIYDFMAGRLCRTSHERKFLRALMPVLDN
jgi:hypothetical protein